MGRGWALLTMAAALIGRAAAGASDLDEFKVKREGPFEFAQKPVVTRQGDRITITFETLGYCDVTVAIEEAETGVGHPDAKVSDTVFRGKIVRHLGSGVLGPNAPEPFQKNLKRQVIVWDGKDDEGVYIDDKDKLTVRVSLGLKPQFERTLFWSPHKRIGLGRSPLIAPQPEGVYVYEGDGVEQVKLFDHKGDYLRTVYPFPAEKIRDVRGLGWRTWPDGYEAPVHIGFWRSTFLTGGVERTDAGPGSSARVFAVHDGHIAMANHQLSRLGTDGTTAGLDLYGPEVSIKPPWERSERYRPKSAAFSPDGKTLYFTGFYENTEHRAYGAYGANIYWIHAVYRMAFDRPDTPAVFAGSIEGGHGPDDLFMPASVACDATGRVYVADHYHDRVVVFSPEGQRLKDLPVKGPAIVQVSPKTAEVYVFSWALPWSRRFQKEENRGVAPVMRRFRSADDWRLVGEVALPFERYRDTTGGGRGDEIQQRASVDFYTDPPTIWMVFPVPPYSRWGVEERCIRLLVEREGELAEARQFGKDVARARLRQRPPPLQRQRLYVDPRDGTLFVAEGDTGVSKAVTQLWKIDPQTGRGEAVELPFSMEDMAIDHLGRAYLRTTEIIGRFDMETWREVPFDYGVDRDTRFSYDARGGHLVGGLLVPSNKPVYWHQSGMDVAPNGDLVVSCVNSEQPVRLRDGKRADDPVFKPYVPVLYPGRVRYGEVHVWDQYGKIKHEDAVPGVPDGHGTYVDAQGHIYLLLAGTRLLDGTQRFGELTGTIMRFTPGKGRFVADGGRASIPLGADSQPAGHPSLVSHGAGRSWVIGADWMYSGIGFVRPGAPCQCWNTRFHVDDFGRSFAPETQRCQVAVLDTNGNLMLHIGRYGNVEDGKPLETKGGPAGARSIGGDEVSLAYACYLATHTDHRLYIADAGNARIVSVRLGYHATERVPLAGVKDAS